MGIALSTLSAALPHSLQNLSRWLQNLVRLEESGRAGEQAPEHAANGHPPGHADTQAPRSRPGEQRTPGPSRFRPLRGNWPFTVQPSAPEPKAPAARPATAASRSLGSTSGTSGRDAFMASITCKPLPPRPGATVRKVSHASGRLVIAGRMADVCAELDRMAACEALQA